MNTVFLNCNNISVLAYCTLHTAHCSDEKFEELHV